ncbi:MAG TPA: hypothetical protein VM513_00120 [Kofleriaceae bacterium]|jgi:hypothetical protein|nr:hypothetical protein [Kofleriaceae bacterium]
MRAIHVLAPLVVLVLGACGDNIKQTPGDAAPEDAPIDAPQTVAGPCLDRPTDLPRPPTGALDCNMLPPGLVVSP